MRIAVRTALALDTDDKGPLRPLSKEDLAGDLHADVTEELIRAGGLAGERTAERLWDNARLRCRFELGMISFESPRLVWEPTEAQP